MTLIQKLFATAIILGFSLGTYQNGFADESKLKSEGVAWALALDPIPGDALLYAGRNIQGAVSLVLGTTSMVGLGFGISGLSCHNQGGDDGCKLKALFLTLGSGVPYFATLIWDGIGGVHYVNKHNAKVRTSFLQSFQPIVAVEPRGTFVGAQFKF